MVLHRSLPNFPARPRTYTAMYIQNGSARGGEQAALEVAEFVPECHLGRSFRNLQRISSSGIGSSGVYISLVRRPDNDVVCPYHDRPYRHIRRGDLKRSALGAGGDNTSFGFVVEPIAVGIRS